MQRCSEVCPPNFYFTSVDRDPRSFLQLKRMGEAKSTTGRTKVVLLLVVTTALTAAGIWMAVNGNWRGYVVASFFGLGVPVALTQLVRSRGLRVAVERQPRAGEAPLLSASQQWLIDSLASHGALERRNPQVLPAGLNRAQLRILVQELAGDDAAVCREAETLLETSDGKLVNVLRDVLARHRRIARVDAREGVDEALAQFRVIFEMAGVKWSTDIASMVMSLCSEHQAVTSHEPVAVVYYVLRELADRAGLEILNVTSGTDEFEFFLAPSRAADRWRSVHLGDGVWVESPEWHFAYTFKLSASQCEDPDR